MTDVRLTALNPVDSQVYPVACNDKGELLLESNESTGNLNVQGDLTVTGTGSFVNGAAEIQGQGFFVGTGFVSYKMAASSYAIHDDDVNWKYSVYYDGTTHIGGYITTADPAADTPNIALNADGSSSFASGNARLLSTGEIWSGTPDGTASGSDYGSGLFPGGAVGCIVDPASTSDAFFVRHRTPGGLWSDPVATIKADGSAKFAGAVKIGEYDPGSSNEGGAYIFKQGAIYANRTEPNSSTYAGLLNGLTTFNILASGDATFVGDVITKSVTGDRETGTDAVFIGKQSGNLTTRINADGSAFFASTVIGGAGASFDGASFFRNNVYIQDASGSSTRISLDNDGNGTFAGNVTAQNITFRLSDQAVAEMPAPLIDEGFAAEREIDLLTELIKMKAEIKNLNAFMQKSIQESSEIEQ